MGFDISSMIMPLIIVGIIVFMVWYVWNLLYGNKKIQQPVTKDQWERLSTDIIISCKLNRVRGIKWIGLTGDKIHPPIPKYMKYRGSIADGRFLHLIGKVKFWTPTRWSAIHWDLVKNFGGRTLWICADGLQKDGYVFRPMICRSRMQSGHDQEYYDTRLMDHIKILFRMQGDSDTIEQKHFEILSSMAHKERSIADLMQKNDQMQVEEVDPVSEIEG